MRTLIDKRIELSEDSELEGDKKNERKKIL